MRRHRRDFLKTSAAVGAGFWISSRAAGEPSKLANGQVNFACIGVGGKGSSDTDDAGNHGKVVALCDIDDNTLNRKSASFPEAEKFNDFREMLDKLGDKIDAVTISTPDHTHAVATVAAMKAGKGCYTQKPLTHSLYEARRLAELAKEKGVATQMGNQGTANKTLREAAAVIRGGALGPVKEVHVWTNRPIWPQGGPEPAEKPVPEHVHWDLWLGPAPQHAYSPEIHPFKWRGFWDFGTGALGDMACHTMNMPFMALDLRDPISVEAQSSGHDGLTYPKWSIIRYEFPSNGDRGPLAMIWYDGGKKAPVELLDGEKLSDTGCLVIGEKGKLYAAGDYCENGHKLLGGAERPEKIEIVESPGHFDEWVRALRGGEPARSNFVDYSGPLTETVLLGNLAVFSGTKVNWDAKNQKAIDMPELDKIIRPEYREGWSL